VDSSLSLGDLLPAAVGIALSPLPIAAVILMLFSARARVNGLLFIAGWIAGLMVVGSAVLVLGGGSSGSSDDPSPASLWLKVILGAALLILGFRDWRSRPDADAEPATPKWMASVDAFAPWKAFLLAILLSGVNPKNLALDIAGVTTIAQADLTQAAEWLWLAVFVVLASLTVVAPVAYYLVAGARAEGTLTAMKTWLIRHNAAVIGVLLLVFGVKLLAEGVQGLVG
jgi:threonine/homoserine/homoserine lactone efflux protein